MSKFKLTYANGETEELDNLEALTADQRSDVEAGIAELTDEEGNEVELPEVSDEDAPVATDDLTGDNEDDDQ